MVTKTGELKKAVTTLVAEFSVTSVTGHVITAGRPLDVDQTEWALLAVGDAVVRASLGPLEELLVPLLELSAAESLVPRCMATEAPLVAALFASDLDIFFTEPSGT